MSGEYEEKSSGTNTVLIVVGVIGAVVLLVVLACAGIMYFAFRTASQAMATMMQMVGEIQAVQIAADTFMADLRAGRIDAAYDSTTQQFRAGQTREAFRALVNKHPLLTNATSTAFPMNQTPPAGNRAIIQMTVSGNNSMTCTLQLLKENEQWKVDGFSVP